MVPTPGPYSTNTRARSQSTRLSTCSIRKRELGITDPSILGCLMKLRENSRMGCWRWTGCLLRVGTASSGYGRWMSAHGPGVHVQRPARLQYPGGDDMLQPDPGGAHKGTLRLAAPPHVYSVPLAAARPSGPVHTPFLRDHAA